MNLIHQVEQFIVDKSDFFKSRMIPKAMWFEDSKLSAYIRVGGYGTPDGIKMCITLANIVVNKNCRQRGVAKDFINGLKSMAELYHFDFLVVENIQNFILQKMLEGDGYTMQGEIIPSAFYRCKKES